MSQASPSPEEVRRARQLERVAIEVAGLAAGLVGAQAGQASAAATKSSPTDVVTHTDHESELFIREQLGQRCPGSTIVGEEYGDASGHNNVSWIVDPIDGTVNFLYDLPVVSVSIAAAVDGRVVAGAVADVHRDEVYSAAIGSGARLSGELVRSSPIASLDQALIGTGFSYDAAIRQEQSLVLTSLLPACRDIRCMGSAALNLCWVGSGRLDGFFERDLKPYDWAAGALIASEAGATFMAPTTANGDLTFAAAPGIAESVLSAIRPA